MNYLQTELAAQKEANVRSPSNTMKNLVERLKAQLAQKEKQLKVPPAYRSRCIQMGGHREASWALVCFLGNEGKLFQAVLFGCFSWERLLLRHPEMCVTGGPDAVDCSHVCVRRLPV